MSRNGKMDKGTTEFNRINEAYKSQDGFCALCQNDLLIPDPNTTWVGGGLVNVLDRRWMLFCTPCARQAGFYFKHPLTPKACLEYLRRGDTGYKWPPTLDQRCEVSWSHNADCMACGVLRPDERFSVACSPCLDHDRRSGMFRGFACKRCISIIGRFTDSGITRLEFVCDMILQLAPELAERYTQIENHVFVKKS